MDVNVEGRVVHLSSLDRVLWPGTTLTKRWLVAYYTALAPVLLPHLAGHPVTLHRFPEGVGRPHFFQTRVPPHPAWLRTVTMRPASTGKVFDVAVVDDVAGLVWAANLSTIELHPYLGRADDLDRPRSVVFDHPDEVVDKMTRALRAGKVFVDWSQNDAGKSTVAPYSLRGLTYPTVATPLRWQEVERGAVAGDPDDLTFAPDDVLRRTAEDGDVLAPADTLEQRLPAAHGGGRDAT